MSIPANIDLTFYQGQTLGKKFKWRIGKSVDDSVPVDLTGCAARLQVRERVASETVLLSLTTENGGIVLGGADGTITMHMSAADTAAIEWRRGVYDLEIEFPDGTVIRRLQGRATVSPEVTR